MLLTYLLKIVPAHSVDRRSVPANPEGRIKSNFNLSYILFDCIAHDHHTIFKKPFGTNFDSKLGGFGDLLTCIYNSIEDSGPSLPRTKPINPARVVLTDRCLLTLVMLPVQSPLQRM